MTRFFASTRSIARLIALSLILLCINSRSYAQKYKVGERVEVDLDDNGKWVKATIKEVNFGPYVNGNYVIRLDASQSDGGIEYTILNNHFNQLRPLGTATNSVAANCSFSPPPGTFNNQSSASVALFKWVVYQKLNNFATGVPGSPVRIALNFLSFDLAKSYKNTVSLQPGRGAKRVNESAPPNATVYPASIKYIVCEDYKPGIKRKMVETKYEFFVDRFAEWNASQFGYLDKTTVLEF